MQTNANSYDTEESNSFWKIDYYVKIKKKREQKENGPERKKRNNSYSIIHVSLGEIYLNLRNQRQVVSAIAIGIVRKIWNSLQPNWKDLSFPKFKEAVKVDLILKYK